MSSLYASQVSVTRQLTKLDTLSDDVRAKLAPVIEDLTDDIAGLARSRAPVREGKYLKSIRTKFRSDATAVVGRVIAGGRGSGGAHANLIEYGTKAHQIRASGKLLRFLLPTIGEVYARRVTHPGTRAQKIIGGALDAKRAEVAAAVAAVVQSVAADAN